MKRVSVYVKGDRSSISYYRIHQYLENIDGIDVMIRTMMSTCFYKKYYPVSKQPILVKLLMYLNGLVRVTYFLLMDFVNKPDIVVIHARLLTRYYPSFFNTILKTMKRCGVKIIWDFDDNIIEGKEISIENFNQMAYISDSIFVTQENLRSIIPEENQFKVYLLPTTDGDLCKFYKPEVILNERMLRMDDIIELVWVATSSNLKHLKHCISSMDTAAGLFYKSSNQKIVINVVCDQPLDSNTRYIMVNNIQWTRDVAIECMMRSHIGVMPLINTQFAKGKGGFKLIQYMSIGLPCIASDVGFNRDVVDESFGVLIKNNSPEEWLLAFERLSNKASYKEYSLAAYNKWSTCFSYETNLSFWNNMIK